MRVMPSKSAKSVDGIKGTPKNRVAKKPAAKKTQKSATKTTDGIKVEVRRTKKPATTPAPLKKKLAIKETGAPIVINDEPAPAEAPADLPSSENDEIMNEIDRLEESDPDAT